MLANAGGRRHRAGRQLRLHPEQGHDRAPVHRARAVPAGGRDGRPNRLTTTADTQHGDRVDQATRSVDLHKKRDLADVRGRLRTVLGDPFQAVAPDRLFFPEQGGKLWSRLNRAELTIGQTYRVKASKQDYPLDVGPFGLGYRSEQTERTLIASRVRLGGGEQEMSCSGQPDVPAPPKKAAEYRTLPSDKVPEPEPSPSLTGSGDPTASPSVLDASASVPPETAATDPTVPAAPVDDLLSVGPDRTPA